MASTRTKPTTGLLSRGTLPHSLINSTLKALPSPNTRRSYAKGIAEMFAFAAGRPVTLVLLQEWRIAMAKDVSAATVNSRITAARCLIREARRTGLIDAAESIDLLEIDGLPQRGARMGNWLTIVQLRQLRSVHGRKTMRGLRNNCILDVLAGCAIRLDELARLEVETIQQRDGRWVLADLRGKGGRVRTVAIPDFAMHSIKAWRFAAKITEGRLIRQLTLKPEGLSAVGIRDIVQKAAAKIGVARFSPHDLRRTCARLCRENGADIEQIQAMLGHASINTTQRYLGTVQNLRDAPNDKLGL